MQPASNTVLEKPAIDVLAEVKAEGPARSLRLITCGSVDDGKSTLIGRLLWDTKSVSSDHADAVQDSSVKAEDGLYLPEFAMLLDGLQAEREQGITIDVAYRYFSTKKRSFIVADTPGHEQYTRNMATGCSTADLAILLVDARVGLLEQTRRHATIAALMGITQFVLVVNKIDLIDYSQDAYTKIVHDFTEFGLSIGITDIVSIPVSALRGDNVARDGKKVMPWYDGPTLLQAMEMATTRSAQTVGFRLPVQRVSRPDESFRGYQGTIAGGAVKPGDSIMVQPSGVKANVTKIVTFDLVRNAGVVGDAVTLVLDRPVDISRGDMITSIESPIKTGQKFEAKLIALSSEGITTGKRYWLKSTSRRQYVTVHTQQALDLKDNQWNDAEAFDMNTIGTVKLVFDEPAMFDTYHTNRDTGSFILIDTESNKTVAGGMISENSSDVALVVDTDPQDTMVLSLPLEMGEKILQELAKAANGELPAAVDTRTASKKRANQLLCDLD